jgi:hypothetical protein
MGHVQEARLRPRVRAELHCARCGRHREHGGGDRRDDDGLDAPCVLHVSLLTTFVQTHSLSYSGYTVRGDG